MKVQVWAGPVHKDRWGETVEVRGLGRRRAATVFPSSCAEMRFPSDGLHVVAPMRYVIERERLAGE